MPLKSLGLASDVLVLRGQSTLEEHEDRFILRSPKEPDFWFGNTVIFKDALIDPDAQIAQFKADFPDAKHVTLQWDQTDMTSYKVKRGFSPLGYKVEPCDVLTLVDALKPAPAPDGIEIRPLKSDADWEQATELQGIIGIEGGNKATEYLPYIKTRMEVCRAQTKDGFGCWFGAFAGDELAGDLGIYADEVTARFQAVETRPSYRRRGICAALVTAGVEWAATHRPTSIPVIIAEADGDAGRIYRRCGFEAKEKLISAYRGPVW